MIRIAQGMARIESVVIGAMSTGDMKGMYSDASARRRGRILGGKARKS